MKEYKYKAFISYRHKEPDMQAAEKLQKLLESYKPPKQFTEKKENWRIFRDVSELQSSSDLSEDIRNAIEDSEFLIIICSPSYNESKWCMQELMHFRELHGNTNDNIITLLVDGEPDKAFPELLRFADMKSVDENGNETTVKVEVEPLAANIKADNLKDSMKKLNTEYLRIAAPLLGCDFNDLYQREKKREAQRRMRIIASAFAVLSVITVISAASAVTIKKKNSEIEDKNDQIEEQFDKIEEQYDEIEKQYSKLVVENAEHLAAESEVLYQNNSLISAVQKAVEALPAKGEDKPAIPEAQYVLSKELGLFNPENIVPRYALKHDYAIEKLSYMGSGKGIVSQDSSGIYFWNAVDGSLIKKITPEDDEFAVKLDSGKNELSAIIEPDTDKTGTMITQVGNVYLRETSTIFDYITESHAHLVTDSEPGTGGDVFVNNSVGTVWRLNGADGEIVWKKELPSANAGFKKLIYDGENLLRIYSEETSAAKYRIMLEIIDTTDGSIKNTIDVSSLGGGSMTFDSWVDIKAFRGNILYCFNTELAETDTNTIIAYEVNGNELEKKWSYSVPADSQGSISNPSISFFNDEPVAIISTNSMTRSLTTVVRFDKETGEPVWNADIQSNFNKSGKVFLYDAEALGSSDDVLAVVDETHYSIIGYSDGKVLDTVTLDEKINSVSFSKAGLFTFTVKNGKEYAVNLKAFFGDKPQRVAIRIQKFGQPFSLCSYSRGRYVTAAEYSNTAYIQFTEKTEGYTAIAPEEDGYCKGFFAASSDGSKLLASFGKLNSDDETLFICDTTNGSFTKVEDLESKLLEWARFLTNDKLVAGVSNSNSEIKLNFVDIETGKLTEINEAGAISDQYGIMDNSVYFFEDSSDCVLKKLTADGSIQSVEFEKSKIIDQNKHCAVGNKAAVFTIEAQNKNLEFCDFDNGKYISADYTFDPSGNYQVLQVFCINEKTAGVLLNNMTVLMFDAETGKLITELKLDAIRTEIVSAAGIGNDRFILLSRDMKLYEADMNGATGNMIDLSGSVSKIDNTVGNSVNGFTDGLTVCQSADSNYFYAVWGGKTAWYIDRNEFKIRYAVGDLAFAPSEKEIVFTYNSYYGRLGYFPIYTVQQLVETASSYLDKLGEVPEGSR